MLCNRIFVALLANCALAKVIQLDWVVEEQKMAPDNYGFVGMTINGQFPGPTINGTMGDVVFVRIHNKLAKDFTMHWHGIVQKGTPYFDGVPYVTQDPIKPGSTFLYHFSLKEQVGTHWYHAHTDMDSEHAFGALIIQDKPADRADIVSYHPKYRYDEERVVILSEIWHKPTKEIIDGLVGPVFTYINPSDSILINGQVYHQWSTNGTNNATLPFNNGNHVINVEKGKSYRLRLIGALGLDKMKFSIPNHKFTIIEADGTYLEPYDVDYLEIFGGQRYSIIVQADQPINNYVISAQRTGETSLSFAGRAILNYKGAANFQPMVKASLPNPSPAGPFNRWIEGKLSASDWLVRKRNPNYYPVPKNVTKHIYLKSNPVFVGTHVDELINDVLPKKRNTTVLYEIINGTFEPEDEIIEINEGDEVQIVMEHILPPGFPECFHHPWHLHGHTFHVVGGGKGRYDAALDNPKLDLAVHSMKIKPLFVDTFTHYPENVHVSAKTKSNSFYNRLQKHVKKNLSDKVDGEPTPCGWYAIRFKANNPGPWYLHCHITAHMVMGKVVIINVNPKNPYKFKQNLQNHLDELKVSRF